MKREQEVYGGDGNEHLTKKLNWLLIDWKILKKVQKAYGKDNNGYLREEMNLIINKK